MDNDEEDLWADEQAPAAAATRVSPDTEIDWAKVDGSAVLAAGDAAIAGQPGNPDELGELMGIMRAHPPGGQVAAPAATEEPRQAIDFSVFTGEELDQLSTSVLNAEPLPGTGALATAARVLIAEREAELLGREEGAR